MNIERALADHLGFQVDEHGWAYPVKPWNEQLQMGEHGVIQRHVQGTLWRALGADPDGNEDWRLAANAVQEVREMRGERDDFEQQVETLRAERDEARNKTTPKAPHVHG